MVLLVSLFWKLQWSIAGICERDSYGLDCFFLSGKDVALEGQLRFIYHPELDWLDIAFIAVDFELYLGLWMKNIYREFNKVRDIIFWKIFCTDRCQYLLVVATSSTVFCLGIEGMAKFILGVKFSMYRENECHVERGCGSLHPLWGTT